ncbi:MAG: HEAT repeat domain-containing protein [Candidatus Riflebacteria bacterium]|nr:HEAT repeat domain-containing protein [Candidatus Riflebacteria bacterium]
MEPTNQTTWMSMALFILKEGREEDRKSLLEYFCLKNDHLREEAEALLPPIQQIIHFPKPELRHIARQAYQHLITLFPEFGQEGEEVSPSSAAQESNFSREILLQKLNLGSRYMTFEAIERLTSTKDESLIQPFKIFLEKEKDPFKISYLLKRLPRLESPEIRKILESYLTHPDDRIVSNALDGLYHLDDTDLPEVFKKFLDSPDNRVRANAIKGLYRFAPETTEKEIESMLDCSNPAFQDSALFLIKNLRPSNINHLLEKALSSRYPTIRLRALEIPRETTSEPAWNEPPQEFEESEFSHTEEKKAMRWMASFFVLGELLLMFFPLPHPFFTMILGFLGISCFGISILKRKNRWVFPIGISIIFLATLTMGSGSLLALLGLLAIWGGRMRPELPHPIRKMRTLAWVFATIAIFSFWLICGEDTRVLSTLSSLYYKAPIEPSALWLMDHYRRFVAIFFAFTAAACFYLTQLGHHEIVDDKIKSVNRLFWKIFSVAVIAIFVLEFSFVLGLKTSFIGAPFNSILDMARFFGVK